VWRSARSALALVVLICAACGATTSPREDREWSANAGGAVLQLREDVLVAVGLDAEQAVRDESSLYTALVVFTDFGGCRHMIGALGSVPRRFVPAHAQLRLACAKLRRAAALFTRAVKQSSAGVMETAIETAQRALLPLDRAGVALRGE
jgi:hypothetical protein